MDAHGISRAARPGLGALVAAAALAFACADAPGVDGPGADAPGNDARRPLRIAVHGDPASLDPHLQSEVIAQWLLGNVYETLVAFDVNMGLVPALAERWENPTDLVARFHLRPGVTFHDGRPFTAADVAFSLDRARHHPSSRNASMLVAVDEVRVVDPRTVEIQTTSHYPILLNKLAFVHIVPRDAPETIEAPVGTGPYRFSVFEPGRRAVIEAYDRHWDDAPAEARAEYLFVSDPARRLELLHAGDVDLIDELPPAEVARVEETPGLKVLSRSGLAVTYLQVNPAVEPFTDARVRRALALAFDREALVREVLSGHGRPVAQMVSPNVYGYVPDLEPPAPDPAGARRLLAEAGHPEGLDLVLEYREGAASLEPVREQLAEIGVRLRFVSRPWSEMYARLQSGEVAFYSGGWVSTSGDASDFLDHKAHSRVPELGYGVSNSNRYSNPRLDKLIEESGTRRMEARRDVLERAMREVAGDDVFLPLYTPFNLYAAREGLRWTPRQDSRVYAFEMEREP